MIKYESGTMEVSKAKYLSKKIWILFWLFVPSLVASILSIISPEGPFNVLNISSIVINIICEIIYCIVLIKLSAKCKRYQTAGICYLAVGVINVIITFVPNVNNDAEITVLIGIISLVILLMQEYNEYKAHAEILKGIDWELSERWEKFWKWSLRLFFAMFGGIFAAMIFSLLGAFILLISLFAVVVLRIMYTVYLYRTAKTFDEYAKYKMDDEEYCMATEEM